jgi:hypothetical protein
VRTLLTAPIPRYLYAYFLAIAAWIPIGLIAAVSEPSPESAPTCGDSICVGVDVGPEILFAPLIPLSFVFGAAGALTAVSALRRRERLGFSLGALAASLAAPALFVSLMY